MPGISYLDALPLDCGLEMELISFTFSWIKLNAEHLHSNPQENVSEGSRSIAHIFPQIPFFEMDIGLDILQREVIGDGQMYLFMDVCVDMCSSIWNCWEKTL